MKLKKILSIMLSLSLVFGMGSIAYASEVKTPDETAPPIESVRKFGTIIEINKDQVTMKYGEKDSDLIVLNCGIKTVFLDSIEGDILSFKDFKVGDTIVAYHSPIMTRSIPGQSPAFSIIREKDEMGSCHFMTVSEIKANESGKILVTDENKSVVVTLPDVLNYLDSSIPSVGAFDVKVGDSIAVWYEITTMSIPAQATALKAEMLISVENVDDGIYIAKDNSIKVAGKAIPEKCIIKDGKQYLPLRSILESLKYDITWISADLPIVIHKHYLTTKLYLNSDKFESNGIDFVGSVPLVVDNITYVSPDFFQKSFSMITSQNGN